MGSTLLNHQEHAVSWIHYGPSLTSAVLTAPMKPTVWNRGGTEIYVCCLRTPPSTLLNFSFHLFKNKKR